MVLGFLLKFFFKGHRRPLANLVEAVLTAQGFQRQLLPD
jgi:hypothetical protein